VYKSQREVYNSQNQIYKSSNHSLGFKTFPIINQEKLILNLMFQFNNLNLTRLSASQLPFRFALLFYIFTQTYHFNVSQKALSTFQFNLNLSIKQKLQQNMKQHIIMVTRNFQMYNQKQTMSNSILLLFINQNIIQIL
jgi:hypothetical protein